MAPKPQYNPSKSDHPFGMLMPGRSYSSTAYKYGFNGKEKDDEVKGNGNQQDYGMRIYDNRLARFLSIDPLSSKFSMLTPYQFASNTPIWAIDFDGLEAQPFNMTFVAQDGSVYIDPRYNSKSIIKIITEDRLNQLFDENGPSTKIGISWKIGAVTSYRIDGLGDQFRLEAGTVAERRYMEKNNITIRPAFKTQSEAMNWTDNFKSEMTDGLGKTFRHILSQAYLTLLFDESTAKEAGDYHERANPNDKDMRGRDLYNNEIGRNLAKSGKYDLTDAKSVANLFNDAVDMARQREGLSILSDKDKIYNENNVANYVLPKKTK